MAIKLTQDVLQFPKGTVVTKAKDVGGNAIIGVSGNTQGYTMPNSGMLYLSPEQIKTEE
jgi:uncharacterized protein YbjQ (UPF0145 family)